jgi:hypothetical protein
MIIISYLIVLFFSFSVVAYIFWKKIPMLCEISDNEKNRKTLLLFFSKIKSVSIFKSFFWNNILLKILLKIKIFLLKIENKITFFLNVLRSKSKKKDN